MQIKANVRFRSRYEGENAVYLTAIETDGAGDLKISGEFPEDKPALHTDYEMEAEVVGRIYNNQLSLRVEDMSKFKLRKLKPVA